MIPKGKAGLAGVASIAVLMALGCLLPAHAAGENGDGYSRAEDPWFRDGAAAVAARTAVRPNTHRARNVILFIADGMGISTITAARIYDGQSRGESGEENSLSFGTFPHVALVKTYNTNSQVPDSAGTASSMNSGVKTRIGVINTPFDVRRGDCAAALGGQPRTIAEMAEAKGLSTGVVSTSLIVDATPAAVYAHAPERGWMVDSHMPEEARAAGCRDIAAQMLDFGLEVALGGGRAAFLPAGTPDPEGGQIAGMRADGRDLTTEWQSKYQNAAYVWNARGFGALDLAKTEHLLGLFEQTTMQYEADRAAGAGDEPSLAEMTRAAIEVLSRNKKGYYLMVEGGRVDHAHHMGNAARALSDAQAFSQAVAAALEMVDLKDTLILVTADHSHVFTMAGYPVRGNPILGLARQPDESGEGPGELFLSSDEKPYTTLGYWNGPGAVSGERADLSDVDTTDLDYLQQSVVPAHAETHAGEDVALFAIGPWSHLVDGVMEQNVIFHIIDHAMGLE